MPETTIPFDPDEFNLKARTDRQRTIEHGVRSVADFWGEDQQHIDDLVEIGDIAVYAADTRKYVDGMFAEMTVLRDQIAALQAAVAALQA